MGRQLVLGARTLYPGVEGEALAEAVLEGQDGEAAAFDQEAQDTLSHPCELGDEVGVLTDRDDTGPADGLAQRFQVIERVVGVRCVSGTAWSRSQAESGAGWGGVGMWSLASGTVPTGEGGNGGGAGGRVVAIPPGRVPLSPGRRWCRT